jgi:hypothetical protein
MHHSKNCLIQIAVTNHKDCRFKFGIEVAIERQKLYNGMDIVESELCLCYIMDLSTTEPRMSSMF